MTQHHSTVETEIKLAVSGTVEAKRLLRAAGLRVVRRHVFEVNTLFDTAGARLRKTGQVLRVRQCGRRVLLTYKGPATRGARHKSREELETEAGDAQAIAAILSRLGFEPVFRYEKYRTEYTGKNGGVATLDETPIGVFLELEGAPDWIDRTAAHLGFTPADYITASYARLYLEHRKRNPRSPKDMVFSL